MWHPWIGRSASALAMVLLGLLAVPAAQAQTFVADPLIPDTTAASACTSPCALRQAVAAAQAAEEAAGEAGRAVRRCSSASRSPAGTEKGESTKQNSSPKR
jgi:hypothetical protein